MERNALHIYLLILCIHLSQRLVSELKLAIDIVVCLSVCVIDVACYLYRTSGSGVSDLQTPKHPPIYLFILFLSYFYLIFASVPGQPLDVGHKQLCHSYYYYVLLYLRRHSVRVA